MQVARDRQALSSQEAEAELARREEEAADAEAKGALNNKLERLRLPAGKLLKGV